MPEADIRVRLDDAVRRGWVEIGWRALRVFLLLLTDTAAGTATAAVLWFVLELGPGLNAVLLLPSLAMIQPMALGVAGAYGPGKRRVSFDRVGIGLFLAVVLVGAQVAILNGIPHERLLFYCAAYFVIGLPLVQLGRLGLAKLVNFVRRQGIGQRRLLVVGTEQQAQRLAEQLDQRSDPHIKIVGRLSATHSLDEGTVGTLADLEGAVKRSSASGIIVDSQLTFEDLETLVNRCFELGVAVMVLPQTMHQLSARLELRSTEAGAMLQVQPEALGVPQLAVKRALDFSISTVLLVLSAPLWLVIAIAIKLDSPGPVLFSQERAGLGGKPFHMHKFRTMVTEADDAKKDLQHLNESGDPRLFKIKDDPRVTGVGSFLRRYSLDEIPQLLNVLKGEMSLVGPRPFFPADMEDYQDHHFERLWVLPGITGLWQVSGRSAIVDFEEVVRLDREYIREWSIWKDVIILAKTLPAAMKRDGAY